MFVLSGKLSRKIVGMLSVFFLVALAAICMTLYLSWQLEGVAAAINDAGSQRMRTYRMAYLMRPEARSLQSTLTPRAQAGQGGRAVRQRAARPPPRQSAAADGILGTARSGAPGRCRAGLARNHGPRARAFLAAAPGQKATEFDAFERPKASSPGSTTLSSPWNRAMRAIPSCFAAAGGADPAGADRTAQLGSSCSSDRPARRIARRHPAHGRERPGGPPATGARLEHHLGRPCLAPDSRG